MLSFPTWVKEYEAFKATMKPVLTVALPTEPGQLAYENQALPKFLNAANEHKALGAYYYQHYKDLKQKEMAQVVWAAKDSAGIADTVKARMIAVSVAMRPQD